MKSLSLDSPESTEHVQRRRHVGTAGTSEPHSNNSSSSRIQSPSSPVHNRRLLSARNMRMSSVELPDDNEKSLSSASTSPCPSPVGGKKSHRLLPTNLYVVLYNFKARHQDELDLKAGYKVTVIDTSDPDWWKGKCLGRVGYFPSKYCSKLAAGEKPLQVTHNLQVSDGDNGLMLLRDQIVIQVGEDLDGMVMIRSGDNRQGVCPLKFLQEVNNVCHCMNPQLTTSNNNSLTKIYYPNPTTTNYPQASTTTTVNTNTNMSTDNRKNNEVQQHQQQGNPTMQSRQNSNININNIFAISNNNHHQQKVSLEKNQFSSTNRPLSLKVSTPKQVSNFFTKTFRSDSQKRPLLLNYTSTNNEFHDSNIYGPNFKIIPDKTGLKISPIYSISQNVDKYTPRKLRQQSTYFRNGDNGNASSSRPLFVRK
ncbi:Stac-like [Carabus blaptoides fortunei]